MEETQVVCLFVVIYICLLVCLLNLYFVTFILLLHISSVIPEEPGQPLEKYGGDPVWHLMSVRQSVVIVQHLGSYNCHPNNDNDNHHHQDNLLSFFTITVAIQLPATMNMMQLK